MSYDYITAGISIVNDVIYADGKSVLNNLGGCCVFAYGGIAVYTDSVLPVTAGGPDFSQIYGPYFEENAIPMDGFYETMPATHHTVLKYETDGRWDEESLRGWEYFTQQKQNCMTKASELIPFLSESTKGLYLDALADDGIFDEIEEIRLKAPNIKIMWEPPTQSSTNSAFHDEVLRRILLSDMYSMNLSEASAFFGVKERESIIKKISELGKPCFLREGEEGASWCDETGVYHLPAYDLSTGVDPTGCGNCSTAAALYAVCEGYKGFEITAVANASAQLCAAHQGPGPVKVYREQRKACQFAKELLSGK